PRPPDGGSPPAAVTCEPPCGPEKPRRRRATLLLLARRRGLLRGERPRALRAARRGAVRLARKGLAGRRPVALPLQRTPCRACPRARVPVFPCRAWCPPWRFGSKQERCRGFSFPLIPSCRPLGGKRGLRPRPALK